MDELQAKLSEEGVVVPVKRGRGRPPKNGVAKAVNEGSSFAKQAAAYNPDEDTRTIISDPILRPYKIIVTQNSHNVVDEIRAEGAIADNPYGYFTSLDNALLKIARLKTTKNKTYSLKEYIDEYKNTINSLREAVKLE
jgi:hypothetical protein